MLRNAGDGRRSCGNPCNPQATRLAAAAVAKTLATCRPTRFQVVAIAVSTGGPKALQEVIPRLPADLGVPVLLVQHMPPEFTKALAETLDRCSAGQVVEATAGQWVEPGRVYLAPGGKHMVVRRAGEGTPPRASAVIGLNSSAPVNSCRPAADVLYRSLGPVYGGRVLAVVMTGMGCDGLAGVRTIKQSGGYCLTQSAGSCVVYGMPRAVDEAGLSDESAPLGRLAERITALVKGGG
jgi:two-component system chemotaxis response regulator CheB